MAGTVKEARTFVPGDKLSRRWEQYFKDDKIRVVMVENPEAMTGERSNMARRSISTLEGLGYRVLELSKEVLLDLTDSSSSLLMGVSLERYARNIKEQEAATKALTTSIPVATGHIERGTSVF